MKKLGVVVGCVALLALLGLAWLPRPQLSTAPAPPSAPHTRRVTQIHPLHRPAPQAATPFEVEFATRSAALTEHCGLAVEQACDGEVCVALTEAPDLDSPLGWAQMLTEQPRFVANTALRDLGMRAGSLPCGAAIDSLTAGFGAAMVERSDGSEVWCAIDSASQVPGWQARARALCDRTAAVLGWSASGFTDPGARILRFNNGD